MGARGCSVIHRLHHNPTRKRGTTNRLTRSPSLTLRVGICRKLQTPHEIRDDIIAVEQEAEGLLDQLLHGGYGVIADLQEYSSYQESVVPWIGRIPSHWIERRGKTLFRKMNRPVYSSDDVVTCFRDGIVTLRKKRRLSGFTNAILEIGYQGIRKGDLVIHALLLPDSTKQQQELVDAIRQRMRPVETSISRFTNEIPLLQEYRTRLTADVVTGKLDVRKFARTLPADIAEEAAEIASSELGDDEFSEADDELADKLAGEPAWSKVPTHPNPKRERGTAFPLSSLGDAPRFRDIVVPRLRFGLGFKWGA